MNEPKSALIAYAKMSEKMIKTIAMVLLLRR
jgi:hypothetical protein